MNKIGVFYGSTTGTTEDVAHRIAEKLNVPNGDIHDASKLNDELVKEYDVLVLGTSTWGAGELQDDWYDGIKVLKKADLSHKFVALFGCGDSDSYSDTFCDGIGILYEELKDTHCTFCGATDPSGYTFDSSVAVINGKFVGLPLDEVNEDGKTDERIAQWTEALKKECITNLKTPTNVMAIERKVPGEIRIFLNHVYEFKKGVRNMVLYTMNKEHEAFAIRRLERQNISYLIQEVNANKINLFFGKAECMDAIRHIIIRPLNHLTPEEDFILGAMLGYDICQQCKRYCNKKGNIKIAG